MKRTILYSKSRYEPGNRVIIAGIGYSLLLIHRISKTMKKIVILQPMFFPWIGVFEQINLSDLYIHYDDVQFPKGKSRKIFINRVQIKGASGTQWLTVPVLRKGTQLINQVIIDDSQNWRDKHLKTLKQNYSKAPYSEEMFDIVRTAYSLKTDRLSELNIFIIEKISHYFENIYRI